MTNTLFQQPASFTSGLYQDNCKKIGSVSKGNRIVSNRQSLENIENQMMNIGFKSNRADAQRELRKSKRNA